jgi:hypothetical protein
LDDNGIWGYGNGQNITAAGGDRGALKAVTSDDAPPLPAALDRHRECRIVRVQDAGGQTVGWLYFRHNAETPVGKTFASFDFTAAPEDDSGSVENALTADTEPNDATCAGASCSTILQKWLAATILA